MLVTIPAGQTTATFSVTVNGDTTAELNETVLVNLISPTNATIADGQGSGTIVNDDFIPIFTIQGSPATQGANGASPYVGTVVTTRGIITARDTNGYYIQDLTGDGNSMTSDAILVFTSTAPAATLTVGTYVEVTGTVTEFSSTSNGAGAPSVTELTGSSAVIIGGGPYVIPAPVIIGEGVYAIPGNSIAGALAVYESLESMLVTVHSPLVTGPTTTSGMIYTVANNGIGATGLLDGRHLFLTGGTPAFGAQDVQGGDYQAERLVITSGLGTSLPTTLNTGTVLNDVTGILGQGFGYPEIQAIAPVTVQTASPLVRTGTTLTGDATHLLLASYNAENLDPTDGAARFTTIANEIINQLNAPGVVALQEIQDNDGAANTAVTSASTTLQMLVTALNNILGANTYAFIDNLFITDDKNGGEPGGNIRVAYLYRTDVVTLVAGSARTITANGGGLAGVDSDQATNINNPFNGSRPPLAVDFTFNANGETFTVINNHFTSKGGSDFSTGTLASPLNAGEVARAAQAQAVNTYVDSLLAVNPNARVIVTGDLNEYEFEQPLTVLRGQATVTNYQGAGNGTATYTPGGVPVLTDLQDILPPSQRYDYSFQGVAQTLDHMLATNALVNAGFQFQPVHINADFYNQTSDHDPLVARFTINESVTPTLVSSTPADNAVAVAVGVNIVLTFSEGVRAGTGSIILRPVSGADVTIAVTDTTQVTFSGATATINPIADLRPGVAYDVLIGSGVIVDTVGNAFAGIALDALDFTTAGSAIIPAGTFATSFTATDPASYTLTAGGTRTQTAQTGVVVAASNVTINIDGTLQGAPGQRAINVSTGVTNDVIMIGSTGIVQTANNDAIRSQSVNGRVDLTNLGQIISTNANAVPTVGGTNLGTGFAVQYNAALGASGAPATDFTSGGVVVNGSTAVTSALIRSDSGDAIRLGSHQTLINYGTINGNGPVNDSPDNNALNPPGGNTSTATTYDSSRGVRINQTNATAVRIENYNTITGAQHGIDVGVPGANNLVIVNAAGATITGRNGSGVGADTTGAAATTVTVDNAGTITGAYGPQFDRAGYATTDGDGDGVDIDGGATIINRLGATIRGTGAGGNDSGGRANNSEGISIGGGSVTNDGTIVGAARGIIVNNDSVASRSGVTATTIINNAAGTIAGQNGFAIRLENKNGNATDNDSVVNYGSITGNGAIPDPAGTVSIQGGGIDTNSVGTLDGITYTGTGSARFIRGDGAAIQMGEGADTLSNYGTIIGNTGRAINLEGGADTLNLFTGGSVTGRMDGGAGADTLRLRLDDRAAGANSGATAGTFGQVVNFETLSVESGTWTQSDIASYATGVSIANGATLVLGPSANIGSGGFIDVFGTFTVAPATTLALITRLSGTGTLVQSSDGLFSLSGADSTFSGDIALQAGTLQLGAANAGGTATITFGSGGQTLRILNAALGSDANHTLANTLVAFASGDVLDFANIAPGGVAALYDSTTGQLRLSSGGATVASVRLTGSYSGFNFIVSADGSGGSFVSLAPVSPPPPPPPSPPNIGTAGNDTLVATTPTATLTGGAGNDVYVVNASSQTVVEIGGEGNDTVFASVNFTLTPNASIETLSAQDQRGFDPINLIGNGFAQQVVGNFGDNLLNGNGGADTLIGLNGNDTYAIADANAVIVEIPGEGYDIVYTNVSYTLTGTAAVEELSFATQGATTAMNIVGNGFDQKVIGNYGANVLNGNGGVDTLIGLLGDDIYSVGDARSIVIEGAGEGNDTVYTTVSYRLNAGTSVETLSAQVQGGNEALNLLGNDQAQTVVGNYGANLIDGGAGTDVLYGLYGADTFSFSTALGNGNVDAIADFERGVDRIQLLSSVFTGLGSGTLSTAAFTIGTTAVGTGAQIVYNQATGQLSFDADGSGSGAAVLFASVTPGLVLQASDFTVTATMPTP